MTTTLTLSTDVEKFELAQRKAKVYASSSLVPKEYQNNIANVMIAMEMADRLGVNDLMAMQNINIIHGRPSFSSQFLISCFNACGRFTAIKYKEDANSCTAYATEISTGEIVTGTTVTLEMAKAEGWTTKNGSKWKTMPQHMLRWRAASFLVRQVAPEVSMGFHTTEEVIDTTARPVSTARDEVMSRLALSPPSEPQYDATEPSTWEDTIAAQTTREGLLEVLAAIDDEVPEGPIRDALADAVSARLEGMK